MQFFLSQAFKNQIIQTLYDFIKQKDIDFQDTTKMLYPLLYPFLAKEYQGIQKAKTKNVDLTTFFQGW